MIRANQQLLFQATNQGLLGIRQLEINYYQSLNVAFGTQAALICGFTYNVFFLNQINHNNGYDAIDVLADIYWLCSSITIAFAVHVILCTMLMQVLGPGLSLNGPVGSMARATEGMRIEQKQIIVAFMSMMVMFSFSTVLSCWVVMSLGAAIGATAAFVVAACCWYYYCERIYLRFYWDRDECGWNSRNGSMDSAEDPVDLTAETVGRQSTAAAAKQQRVRNGRRGLFTALFRRKTTKASPPQTRQSSVASELSSRQDRLSDSGSSCGYSVGSGVSPRACSVLSRVISAEAAMDANDAHSEATELARVPSKTSSAALSAQGRSGVVLEGYMTKRGGSGHKRTDHRNEPWERRFFTLSSACNIFIYKNRNDYRMDSKKPIYTRPLRLQDYYIEVFNMNDPMYNTAAVDEDPANPYRFQMTLVLREYVDAPVDANPALTLTLSGVGTGTCASVSRLAGPGVSEDSGGTANPLSAGALRQAIYRDHWVLQCDTEEELLLWVCTMRELCPSCFRTL